MSGGGRGAYNRIRRFPIVTRDGRRENRPTRRRREENLMRLILLIIVILLLVGALPTWPYSSGWGYYPSGGLGLLLIILIILALMNRGTRTIRSAKWLAGLLFSMMTCQKAW